MDRPSVLFAILLSLASAGCGEAEHSAPASPKDATKRNEGPVADKPVSDPYPTATHLRLFVAKDYGDEEKTKSNPRAGRLLNRKQRKAFEAALFLTKPPEEVVGCFIPHHFFRYFDKRGRQVGEVEVCFCCSGIRASGEGDFKASSGQILAADYDRLKALVEELGESANVLCN